MTLNLQVPERNELKPRLTVFGVGGAGGNAVNNMIARSLEGVDFVVANTDAQALALSEATHKIQLGEQLTEGLGAGAKPEIGARAAEESLEKITDLLVGSHMCFITAGMGGGTGTGAAPIIAQAARSLGILTVGVVTKPFGFEGGRRSRLAEEGIAELQQYVDTLIIIPNQNLFRMATENTLFTEAFGMADDVLYQGVKGVTDLMVRPGLVNLDFADVKSVMDEMGKAMMGTGEAEGDDRALEAANRAIANPLLDEISLNGARGVLINITGGEDMTIYEIHDAVNQIQDQVDPEANIIFGASHDREMTGKIRVSVVATGIDVAEMVGTAPVSRKRISTNEAAQTIAAPEAPASDLFTVAQGDAAPSAAALANEVATFDAQEIEPIATIAEEIEPPFELTPEMRSPEPTAAAETRDEADHATAHDQTILDRARAAAQAMPPAAPPMNAGDEGAVPRAERPASKMSSMYTFMRQGVDKRTQEAPAAERRVAESAPQPNTDEHKDRVEIPAFLRRQAN